MNTSVTEPVQPMASVIVVNWNGLNLLKDCLDSLRNQTWQPLEIILVDNGSTDGSVAFVRENYGSRVKVVALAENRGFAGGNNAGIDVASGEFILMINNDAVAEPTWAEALIRAALSDSTIGGCSSKILLHSEPEFFENTGLLLYPDGSARGRGRLERDTGQFQIQDEIACPSGCACLYRKEAISQVQAFDPEFFCYCDDTELGLKVRLAGWRHVYVPQAIAYHKESRTAGKYSPLKAYLVERNRIWVMLKTYPLSSIILSFWYSFLRYTWNAVAVARGTGAAGHFVKKEHPFSLVKILLKAHGSALMRLPAILNERVRLQRLRPKGAHPLGPWLGEKAIGVKEFTQIS